MMSENKTEELKTTDGYPVKNYQPYMLIDGTQVYVDICAKRTDGKTVYQVTPMYEGDAMHMECYGDGPVEVKMPYEHHGEPMLVKAVYKELPKKLIDDRYSEAMSKVESAALAAGMLKLEEQKLSAYIMNMKGKICDLKKEFDERERELEPAREELEELQEQLDKGRQKLSELEDESSSYIKSNDNAILIDRKELAKLRRDEFKLECLERGKVCNWEWYDESLEDYTKRYPND